MAAEPISVTQAVADASGAIRALPNLVVMGEVSGWRGPNGRSGHCYFDLKDETSSMSAIMWSGVYRSLDPSVRSALRDGLEVQATGAFSVYERRGSLSFQIKHLEIAGEGLLRQKVAALARKLEAEGLMADDRKRHVPVFCTRVAVVTSLTGSVIDDVKRTLKRRNPLVEIQVAGCSVQGDEAPATIIHALKLAASARPDAILLVRGGGSLEDLMAFNDEGVARAIAACPVPVVTGIGHEPDVTIADMVADRRQSTPTAAAESVAPSIDVIERTINERAKRLGSSMESLVAAEDQNVERLAERMHRAASSDLAQKRIAVEALGQRPCLRDPAGIYEERLSQLELTAQRLADALPRTIAHRRELLDQDAKRLRSAGSQLVVRPAALTDRLAGQLDALAPTKVLLRGYAIATDEAGHVVSDASKVAAGDRVSVRLASGSIDAEVTGTHAGSAADQ